MLIIPAIDVKNGKCVRLRQGRMSDETVYDENPMKVADRWVEDGAERIHIVDLDGALAGQPVNVEVIEAIARSHPDIVIQVGGGIRSEEAIDRYLNAGVQYVIIGTRAVSTPHFVGDVSLEFPGHIIIGLDARDGKLAIDGWSKLSSHDVIDLARKYEEEGVEAFIYTDVSRDGMLQGVNIDSTVELAESVRIPVIASGGVKNLDDVRKLHAVSSSGIAGVIAGRSLYEGVLDFKEAKALVSADD